VDSLTDPPEWEQQGAYTVERLVRIDPCFLCYTPPVQYVDVPAAAAAREGAFTFGSFNAAMKLSDHVLGLWSRILASVAGSRMIIKASGMEEESVRESLRERMVRMGIDPSRVEVVGRTQRPVDHMLRYHEVDLALDTFPYHGTTTTCEAMFMGVPVLTLAGQTHAARVGVSLLTNVGLPELVCHSDEEYVQKAVMYGTQRDRLAALRTGLRERLLASPLCDGKAYGARMGEALRGMWRAHCEGT
jgi:protein O-GlcNAc transferase